MIKKVKFIALIGLLSCFAADGMKRTKGVQNFSVDTMGLRPVDMSDMPSSNFRHSPTINFAALEAEGEEIAETNVVLSEVEGSDGDFDDNGPFTQIDMSLRSQNANQSSIDQDDLQRSIALKNQDDLQKLIAQKLIALINQDDLQKLIAFCSRVESKRSTAADVISDARRKCLIPVRSLSIILAALRRMKKQQPLS